jgi:hypothetical protein
MNLQNWVKQAKTHWKEFRPTLYASLEKSGNLEAALQDAAERTYREVTELEDQGFDHQDAWEMVRERYLFVPEEGPTAYSESYLKRPMLSAALHEAIGQGTRTIDIPQPLGASPKQARSSMEDRPRVNYFVDAEAEATLWDRDRHKAHYAALDRQQAENDAKWGKAAKALVAAAFLALVWWIVFGG